MRRGLATAWRVLTDLLLDPTCAGCGAALGGSRGPACRACLLALERAAGACCVGCSLPLPGVDAGDASCPSCRDRGASPPVAAPRPHEGVTRRLVLALKAGRRPEIAEVLAAATFSDVRVEAMLGGADLLVPVPAHPLKMRERGYDQAELLARELRCRLPAGAGRPRVARVLRRRGGESAQAGRSRADRRRAPARSLQATLLANRIVAGRRVVLIDDVVTTGASLRAASRLLKRLGASDVCAVAVTRTGRLR